MNRTFTLRRAHLAVLSLPIMFILAYYFVQTTGFQNDPSQLAKGLTLDLLITIPFVYFLLIRKTDIPKTTIVPVVILGLIIGYQIIPNDEQLYLNFFKHWILPFIELSILTFVVLKVRNAIKIFKTADGKQGDFYETLNQVCHQIVPGLAAHLVANEMAVIYYGFIKWGKSDYQSSEYTYHKRSGTASLFGALIFIIGVETLAVHLLLHENWPILAWILAGISIYSAFQVLGFAKSLSKRPITVHENILHLKYGILADAKIDLTSLESYEFSRKALAKDGEVIKLSPLGELEGHNLILRLKKEHQLDGLYGIKKHFKAIAFFVDDKEAFKVLLDSAIEADDEGIES